MRLKLLMRLSSFRIRSVRSTSPNVEPLVYDVKMTQFLCTSEPNGYPGSFGYIPSQHEDDEMLRA